MKIREKNTMAWELDPVHSLIEVSVKHMMVSTVKGRFKKFTVDLALDEQNPENSSIDVTADAASIDTGQEMRDNHLRSPDFLDVANFPTITFKSKKVERQGEEHARVIGDLTIRGVTKEVAFDATFEGEVKDMQGKRRAAFSAKSSISRKDFGLNWNVALESGGWLVSDKVQIAIELEVVERVPEPAEAATAAN
jgi:polyisoprenoid-binding protein YceI